MNDHAKRHHALLQSKPLRDVEWCEAELRAGRAIEDERIHLTRKIAHIPGAWMRGCHCTMEFEGWWPFEGPEPGIAAIFDEHGLRPGPSGQN